MVRLSCVVLFALSVPAAASADPPEPSAAPLSYLPHVPPPSRFTADQRFGRTQIAPNLHFGFGVFGLKSEKSAMRPVTRRELELPKQRRAGVGLSLKF